MDATDQQKRFWRRAREDEQPTSMPAAGSSAPCRRWGSHREGSQVDKGEEKAAETLVWEEKPKKACACSDAAALLSGDLRNCAALAHLGALQQNTKAALETAKSLGARFAGELFKPQGGAASQLCHRNRSNLAAFGETSVLQTTQKLRLDFAKVAEGGALYWPQCVCQEEDRSLFEALYTELAPWQLSPYRRSRHPACVEEEKLLTSPAYCKIVALLREVFGIRVGYSIVNLYANGDDWTEYHRDNYRAEGNRMANAAAASGVAHDATIGASFGASRELRFRHLETGLEFAFPQGNGDVFAFTEPVNSAFQHCIPRSEPSNSVGPRISVILWGRLERSGLLVSPS